MVTKQDVHDLQAKLAGLRERAEAAEAATRKANDALRAANADRDALSAALTACKRSTRATMPNMVSADEVAAVRAEARENAAKSARLLENMAADAAAQRNRADDLAKKLVAAMADADRLRSEVEAQKARNESLRRTIPKQSDAPKVKTITVTEREPADIAEIARLEKELQACRADQATE